ncbi:MAG: FRG domain-containing protein [Henriciella sp.]|nr:FRG domain-containing protein [Henriciella sp.]
MSEDRNNRVHTIPQFLNAVEQNSVVQSVKGGTTEALFRGHSSIDYELLPTIYRDAEANHYEREMVRDFINNCSHLISTAPRNYIEWLFLMQHHGLPTRLLDWSESALVALFFAVESSNAYTDKNVDSCVWILNPWRLNDHADLDRNTLPSTTSKDVDSYTIDIDDPEVPRAPSAEFPLCVRSLRNSARAVNQKAMVTIHGSERIALEKYEDLLRAGFLSKIVIAGSYRQSILSDLDRLGISHDFIYPGLDGLARTIKFKHLQRE